MYKMKLTLALVFSLLALGSSAFANPYGLGDVVIKEVDLGSCVILPDLSNITLEDLDLVEVEGNELVRDLEEQIGLIIRQNTSGYSKLPYLEYETTRYLGEDQPQTFYAVVKDRSLLQVDYFAKNRTLLIIQDRNGKAYEKEISTMQSLTETIAVSHQFEVVLANRSGGRDSSWVPAGTIEDFNKKIVVGLKAQNDINLKEIKVKAKKFLAAQTPNKCP